MTIEESLDKEYTKGVQQNWLEKVRNICQDKECLIRAYEERLKDLSLSPAEGYNFTGTSWRSFNSYNEIMEFREGGIVAFKRNNGNPSYGQWKYVQGTLRFDKYNEIYVAKIDGDLLVGHKFDPNLDPNSSANFNSIPQSMRPPKTTEELRWYRADNEKINQMMKKDFEQSVEDMLKTIESSRQSVLGEPQETNVNPQKDNQELHSTKKFQSLCEPTIKGRAYMIAVQIGRSGGDLCYEWYGTRQEWKDTILKEGCKGRCTP